MRIIDAHVHLYPPEVNADPVNWARGAGESHWGTLCTRRRNDGRAVQGFPSVEELLRDMDEAGIAEAVLLAWYWETAEACLRQNDFYAEVAARHGDRLRVCAAWHPDLATTVVQSWRDQGFVGIGELSPHSIGLVADARWHELFAAAGAAGLPVNLHVTDPRSRSFPGKVDTPLMDFLGWARAHPSTTFVLAHGGGRMPWFKPEVLRIPNVVFDLAAFPLLYPPPGLDAWLAQCGPAKLLWGSDHPLDLYPRSHDSGKSGLRRWCEEWTDTGFGDEVLAAVMGGNAQRIYGRRQARTGA